VFVQGSTVALASKAGLSEKKNIEIAIRQDLESKHKMEII
jgi:hypothetical protein